MIMFDRYCFSFQIQNSLDGELRSQVSYIRTTTRDKLMLILLNCQDFIPGHVLRVVARGEKRPSIVVHIWVNITRNELILSSW